MKKTHTQDGLKLKNYDIDIAKKIGERQRAILPTCNELYDLMERVFKTTPFCDEIINKLKNDENPSPLFIIKHYRLDDEVKEHHIGDLAEMVMCLNPMQIVRTTINIDGNEYEVEEYIDTWSEFFEQYSMDKTLNAKAKFFRRLEVELEEILKEVTAIVSGINTYAKKFYENNKPKIHKWLSNQMTDKEITLLADALAKEEDMYKKENLENSFFFKKWIAFNRQKPQLFHNTKVMNFIKDNYVFIDGEYQDVSTSTVGGIDLSSLDLGNSPVSGL